MTTTKTPLPLPHVRESSVFHSGLVTTEHDVEGWCHGTWEALLGSCMGFVVCFSACSFRQGLCESLWPKDDLPTGVPDHHLPGSLLCFGKFWRSQRKDEVSLFFPHLEKTTYFSGSVSPLCLSLISVRADRLSSCFCLFCRDFAKSITRPFSVYFNPYTQSIEILKDTRSIENVVQDLRSDLNTVCDALNKMNQYLGIWCLGRVSLPAWPFRGLVVNVL